MFIEKERVKDPHNLDISLWINDKIKQNDNTNNMHFKIPDLLFYLSEFLTLNPGDLILTGTPHGVGPIDFGDKVKGNIKQNDELLVEMKFNVEKLL